MIREIAILTVQAGKEAAFEAGAKEAKALFERARGCSGVALHRSMEAPQRYFLIVQWDSVEDHTVHFRQSADFARWRELVGECFAGPPDVQHMEQVM